MKFIKHLIVTVTLAMFGIAAQAQIYVPKDLGSPGDFDNSWTFLGDASVPHVAGEKFVDTYIFNVPDAQNISVSLTSLLTRAGSSGVSFLNGGFVLKDWANNTELYNVDATKAGSIISDTWALGSGTYGLYVVGTYLVNGGTYGGQIWGTPLAAVPEPSSVLMLLAGMALVAGVAQRRRRA
ncbi:FxDxF family PEP-CTERM protein [Duganella callida]|uniref:PEP-CTERM sorting domain-containing protein n=1 Tax=Duganella callida TaxID=2561932 RepID=A0A4Y9SMU0_9BURK|nr:FxDxF family PEP-CTERM protein [Duganella callida]TFW23861.1 PEP-CTERM sorting domain-containing protein [Duganella callida]